MADVTDTFYAGDAFIGYGTQVLVGQDDGSPETFVAIPDVTSITMGDMTTGVVNITHLRSSGRHHEKKATIRDSGPITLVCNYRPDHGAHKQGGGDGFAATKSPVYLWRNVVENNFRLVMPDDSSAGGSPGTGVSIDIRGVITKYHIGEFQLETPTQVTIEITPLTDYSDGLPS